MYLYGASGHGRVIKEIIEVGGGAVKGFIDDNTALSVYDGLAVVHSSENLSPVIVSIGANATRKKIVEKLNAKFGVAIHPSAIVSPSAEIGEGTVIMAGAIINAGAKIGKHCIINTGATIDHECVIEDYVHLAPQVALCGQVHIGEGTLMGVGSCAIPCVKIGNWCTVGAGAVVLNDVEDGKVIVGIPAKILKYNDLSFGIGGGKSLIINNLRCISSERRSYAA